MSYVLFDNLIVFLFDAILLQEHCTYYQRSVLFFSPKSFLPIPNPPPTFIYVEPRSHDSANDNTAVYSGE